MHADWRAVSHQRERVPVRKTESRLPSGHTFADLGETSSNAAATSALISFNLSPLIAGRQNTYIALIAEPALAGNTESFEWIFVESGGNCETYVTSYGEQTYTPRLPGLLSCVVRVLDTSEQELARLEIEQRIYVLNVDLELLMDQSLQEGGPTAGDREVSRELVNDLNPFYSSVKPSNGPQTSEEHDAFRSLVFQLLADALTERRPDQRTAQLAALGHAINEQLTDDLRLFLEDGYGIAYLRLPLLAMCTQLAAAGPVLAWEEVPEEGASRQRQALDSIISKYLALSRETQIDLFNLVRFPKPCVTACARVVETLRDRYFPGSSFTSGLTGFDGTRATWIVRHYRDGPLLTS
jgi:hypothetical protein